MMRKSFRINTKCVKYENANILPEGTVEDALCKSDFQKEKSGKIFEFKRPAFKSGIEKTKQTNPHFKDIRTGTGNYNIERNNFLAPALKGRQAVDFERLQLQDMQDAGVKVQLGDKTLEQLFGIQVLDKTDTEWLREYNRRKASGESEQRLKAFPPLGRPQRKVKKSVNFAQQGLQLEDRIEMLKTAVSSNHIENKQEIADVSTQIAIMLGDITDLNDLTDKNLLEIKNIASRLNIPRTWQTAGLTHRIYSWKQYQKELGPINMFILNITPRNRINYPVKNVRGRKYIKLSSILGALKSNKGQYLDLEEMQIISQQEAKDKADAGIDGGMLDDLPAPPDGWVASGRNPMTDFAAEKGVEKDDPGSTPVGTGP
jgi:hypothetical protein